MRVLKRLLHPLPVADWLQHSYEREATFVERNDEQRFADIASAGDVDFLARCPHLKTAVHGVVTAQNKELRNKPAELQRRFAAGETVVANEVGPVHNGLSSIMNSLEDALGVSGNANLYLTPPNSIGFEPHWDWTDSFIVQVAGAKEWLICDAAALNLTAPLPNRVDKDPESPFHNQFTLAQLEQAAALQQATAAPSTQQQQQQQQEENNLPDGVTTPLAHQPCVNITMQPGSVLYMPRGTIHAPHTTADSHSFHATLGFPARQFAWFDTLLSVTRTLTALDLKRGGDKGMATQLADLVAYTGPDTNVGVAAVDSEGGTAVQEQGRLAQRPAGPLNSGTVGHLVKRTLQAAADRDWVLRARFPMWAVRGQPSASKPGAGNPLAEPRAGQGKRTWAFVRRQVRQLLSRLLLRATAANATQEEEAHGRALAEVVAEQLGVDASDASWSGVVEGAVEGLRAHLVNELELEVEAEQAEGGVRWKEVARARRAAAAAVRKKSGSPKKKKVKRRRERGSDGSSSSSRRTPSTTGARFDEGIAQAIDLLRLKRKTFKEVQQGVAANKFPQPKTKIDVGSHMRF